jgi:hypothetical protein
LTIEASLAEALIVIRGRIGAPEESIAEIKDLLAKALGS